MPRSTVEERMKTGKVIRRTSKKFIYFQSLPKGKKLRNLEQIKFNKEFFREMKSLKKK